MDQARLHEIRNSHKGINVIRPSLMSKLAEGPVRLKLTYQGRRYPMTFNINSDATEISIKFPFSRKGLELVKTRFGGRKWDKTNERWTMPLTMRNLFLMDLLSGGKPHLNWRREEDYTDFIKEFWAQRDKPFECELFQHQIEMINLALNSRHVILAADMGLGKTLTAIVVMEILGIPKCTWVAPNAPLAQAKNEFRDWRTLTQARWLTYRGAVKWQNEYTGKAPKAFIIDESAYIKNKSQRTDACLYIADCVREEHGLDSLILLLSGKPAPKSPPDWFNQVEAICPGAINENSKYTLERRLGLWKQSEYGEFQELVTWYDNEDKCAHCGEIKLHPNHQELDFEEFIRHGSTGELATYERHEFQPSVNEVIKFGQRLNGFCGVWQKEDCTDLPPKQFHVEQLVVTPEMLNLAKSYMAKATSGSESLIFLRTLSDGFVYQKIPTDQLAVCQGCHGEKQVEMIDPDTNETFWADCHTCHGEGSVPLIERVYQTYPTPKLDYLHKLLELHKETGRFVTFAAFQASVDIITNFALQKNWQVIQADGRGWMFHKGIDNVAKMKKGEMLDYFQKGPDDRVLFVGQPGAAGSGLTLHRSPGVFFYSNDNVPNNRFQAIDRVHRIGMRDDGGHVYDCLCLPSDKRILSTLNNSERLSSITLDQLKKDYEHYHPTN
ncbi:MAG: hypothetical protein CL489_06425 [Acidobacteria bacterium]|nr:hypothetical protein [Acidobacteriota bacterium]|tara:strand:+ start:59241 stop:61238 length:1998 start_codon:yes stop_codon:yes gene_type:complete